MGTSRRYQFRAVSPPDPLGRAPVELAVAPGPTDDGRSRNHNCPHVAHCLDVASRWAGFSCVACRHFGARSRTIDDFGARRTE